jgi:hypothetical protein
LFRQPVTKYEFYLIKSGLASNRARKIILERTMIV